jgi:hypothetical protein
MPKDPKARKRPADVIGTRSRSLGEPPYFVGMSPEPTDEQTEALVQLLSRTALFPFGATSP